MASIVKCQAVSSTVYSHYQLAGTNVQHWLMTKRSFGAGQEIVVSQAAALRSVFAVGHSSAWPSFCSLQLGLSSRVQGALVRMGM
jgi:hypothetical protein